MAELSVVPGSSVLGEFLSGGFTPRTERHSQKFIATLRPKLDRIKALSWIQLQDVSYNVNFDWSNGPVGRNTGASIRNMVDLRAGVSLKFQDMWRKFSFYKGIEYSQQKYVKAKESERATKTREREAAKKVREARKLAEKSGV